MLHLTRRELQATVRPGDGIAVEYLKADGVARLLRWAEGGRATHFIECLGGLDTFEETIGGGMLTNLGTYLRGQCNLTLLRAPGEPLTEAEQTRVKAYWANLAGKGYGWDSIKRSAITVPVRRFIKPRAPRLAAAMIGVARFLHAGKMPDCSAAWVAGLREVGKSLMAGYEAEEVSPEDLRHNRELVKVVEWKAPYYQEG